MLKSGIYSGAKQLISARAYIIRSNSVKDEGGKRFGLGCSVVYERVDPPPLDICASHPTRSGRVHSTVI
jgi:hypothetical protein